MSESAGDVPPPKPLGEQPSGGDRPPTDDADMQATAPDEKGTGASAAGWLSAWSWSGVVAALAVGYAVGGNSRDDDVSSAETQAAQADKSAAASEQALKDDQAQDKQAVEAIGKGFEDLSNAIAEENAKDDQAAKDAVNNATEEIQGGLEKLHGDVSENVNKALDGPQPARSTTPSGHRAPRTRKATAGSSGRLAVSMEPAGHRGRGKGL